MTRPGFDRLRARSPVAGSSPAAGDPQGQRSLYSVAGQPPALGTISLDCSRCARTSVVTPRQLLLLAVPSVHLPWLKPGHGSWLRCPACRYRTWVSVAVRL